MFTFIHSSHVFVRLNALMLVVVFAITSTSIGANAAPLYSAGQVNPLRSYVASHARTRWHGSRNVPGSATAIRNRRGFSSRATQSSTAAPQFFDTPEYLIDYGTTLVATADFNNDGTPDFVALLGESYDNCAPGSRCSGVNVYLGSGDGSFQPAWNFILDLWTHGYPTSMAVGDFNTDGNADVVVGIGASFDSGQLLLFLGNGDGTFRIPVQDLRVTTDNMVVGDFNHDGNPDLAVTPSHETYGMVLLGDGKGGFPITKTISTEMYITVSAVGDFNGDGNLDLAGVGYGYPYTPPNTWAVRLYFGNGDGSFPSPVGLPYVVDASASITVGSLMGNNVLDLIVTCSNGTVCIVRGNGDGSFQAPVAYGTTPADGAPVIADFNHDGKADVAFVDSQGSRAGVLLGNGDGTLGTEHSFGAGNLPSGVVAADFNVDGNLDLLTSELEGVSILLGNGDGTFRARPDYGIQAEPSASVFGDLNGDGNLDLVVTTSCGIDPQCAAGTVNVLLANPDSTFNAPLTYSTGAGASAAAVADLNRDGDLDLVTANYISPANGGGSNTLGISVLLGNPDGTFQTHVDYVGAATTNLGFSPAALAVADLNGDGNLDVVATGPGIGAIVWLGRGDGSLQSGMQYSNTGGDSSAVAVGDFNGDGKPDLAITNGAEVSHYNAPSWDVSCRGNTVSVMLGNGDGSFGTPHAYATGFDPESVAVGDFDQDGKLDMLVMSPDSFPDCEDYLTGNINASFAILSGNGDGTFSSKTYPLSGLWAPKPIAAADFNLDGRLDFAVGSSQFPPFQAALQGMVGLFLGNGNGTFQQPTMYATGLGVSSIAAGDFTKDGKLDLVTANAASSTVSLLRNIQGPDFSVQMTEVGSMSAGQSASSSVTIKSILGFGGSVALSCVVSPSPASAPTCSLSPPSVQLAANGSASSTLAIHTTAGTVAADRPSSERDGRKYYAVWLTLSGIACGMVGVTSKRRTKLLIILLCAVAIAGLMLQCACGGGSTHSSGIPSVTPAGTYTVTVTATAGNLGHNMIVYVVVQ